MSGVLRHTLVVRNPDTTVATALLAGEKVPDWAKDLVHPDDLTSSKSKKADTSDEAPETGDYEAETVKALKAEVDNRNKGRSDDDLIVVEAPGNKPEVIAALQADDAAQA